MTVTRCFYCNREYGVQVCKACRENGNKCFRDYEGKK